MVWDKLPELLFFCKPNTITKTLCVSVRIGKGRGASSPPSLGHVYGVLGILVLVWSWADLGGHNAHILGSEMSETLISPCP